MNANLCTIAGSFPVNVFYLLSIDIIIVDVVIVIVDIVICCFVFFT